MKKILVFGALALVTGCGERTTTNGTSPDAKQQPIPEATPSPAQNATPTTPQPTPDNFGRASRYTSLEDCTLVRENAEEAGYAESRCPGLGGYQLRLVDADARQDLTVERPGGGDAALGLTELGGGGFSSIGKSIEWRGSSDGGELHPHAMIIRYKVVETPISPGSETPYLMVISLRDAPCVTDKIAPGANQNERARAAADAGHACLR